MQSHPAGSHPPAIIRPVALKKEAPSFFLRSPESVSEVGPCAVNTELCSPEPSVLRLSSVTGVSGRGVFALSSAALWARRKEIVQSYLSGGSEI